MFEEQNLDLKRQMLSRCALPLIDGMQKLVPQLVKQLTDLSIKLKERG